MFIIFYCLRVARSQGRRVFLSLCLCDFVTFFDCKNIMKNISRQTDNFDMLIDFVNER